MIKMRLCHLLRADGNSPPKLAFVCACQFFQQISDPTLTPPQNGPLKAPASVRSKSLVESSEKFMSAWDELMNHENVHYENKTFQQKH